MNVRAPSADDAGTVAAIAAAYDIAHWGETDTDAGEVRAWWAGLDLERDAWLVELDGRLVGYAQVERDGDGAWADGYVHPDATGRGVGARLVDVTEARARERGARFLRNGTLADDGRATALLEGRGYRPVRHFFRMRIDLGDEPPAPVAVDGVELGSFDPERDAEAVHATIEAAFADEWAYESLPFAEWRRRRLESERFDPGLWPVARAGAEVVGTLVGERRSTGGWIAYVSVLPAWRRLGLGLALLKAAFAAFHARGVRRVELGVDTQNPTGATRLYERAGMRVVMRITVFEKELA